MNFFVQANSSNIFGNNIVENTTTAVLNSSFKIHGAGSLGVDQEKSLIDDSSNTSYHFRVGLNSSSTIESGVLQQTTILNKTKEIN